MMSGWRPCSLLCRRFPPLALDAAPALPHGASLHTCAALRQQNSSSDDRNTKRWLHYDQTSDAASAANMRERNRTVTSYYNQPAIDKAAAKVSSGINIVYGPNVLVLFLYIP